MTDKKQIFLEKLKSQWVIAVAIISSLALFINNLEKIFSRRDFIVQYWPHALVFLCMCVCLTIYFWQETEGESIGIPVKRKKLTPKQRNLSIVGLLLSTMIFVTLLGWTPVRSLISHSDDIIILITKFNGPDQTNLGIQETIYSNLEDLRKTHSDIYPVESDAIVRSSGEAQDLGKKERADIVIWGWARQQGNSVQAEATFEPIGDKNMSVYELRNPMQPISLEENEEFQLNIEISADSAYLTSSALGFSHYQSRKYESAIAGFEEALKQAEYSSSNDYIDRGLIHGYLGNLYVSTQQYDKAISNYLNALRDNPSDFLIYLNIGRTYSLLGDYQNSLKIYDLAISSLVEVDGEPIPYCACKAYTGRGMTFLSTGKFDEAIQDFKQALALDASYVDAQQGLVIAYLVTENFAEAHLAVDALIESAPSSSEVLNYKGLIFQAEGDYETAISFYEEALELSGEGNANALFNRGRAYLINGRTDDAIGDLRRLTTLTPDNPSAWSALGIAYSNQSNWGKAIESFNQAISLDEESYRDHNLIASAYRYTGRQSEAIKILKESIKINSSFYLSHKNLGILYADISQPEDAVIHYEQALDIIAEIIDLPDNNDEVLLLGCELDVVSEENCQLQVLSENERLVQLDMYGQLFVKDLEEEKMNVKTSLSSSYRVLGDVEYYQNQNYDEALAFYQKAVENWGSNTLALMRRGSVYSTLGRSTFALEDLNRAITLGLGNRSNLAQAYIVRANIHNQLGNYNESIEDVNASLDLSVSASNSDAWTIRGISYLNQGVYKSALEDFEISIRIEPDNPANHFYKAATLRKLQQYQEAIEGFNLAIDLDPDYDWAYFHRGLVYQEIGDLNSASTDLKKALEVSGDEQLKQQVRKTLNEISNN